VDNRTHVVIIQSVLDQDVATIEMRKKDRYNNVHLQLWVMNTCTVKITFTNPYTTIHPILVLVQLQTVCIKLVLGYYPSYYYTWNPFQCTDRNNIQVSLNINNNYNCKLQEKQSSSSPYNSRRSNGYERQIQIIFREEILMFQIVMN
jgi:hypothetical protein